jgi:hypothetical protein
MQPTTVSTGKKIESIRSPWPELPGRIGGATGYPFGIYITEEGEVRQLEQT